MFMNHLRVSQLKSPLDSISMKHFAYLQRQRRAEKNCLSNFVIKFEFYFMHFILSKRKCWALIVEQIKELSEMKRRAQQRQAKMRE